MADRGAGWAAIAAAVLAVIVGLVAPAQSPADAQAGDITYIHLVSEEGEPFGFGRTLHFTSDHGDISSSYLDGDVMRSGLSARIDTDVSGMWSFFFLPPAGDAMAIGPYDNAGSLRDGNPVRPRIDVYHPEGECDSPYVVGSFEVMELELDAQGQVAKAAIDFEAHCGSLATPALHGRIRFHASSDTYPPAPDSDSDGIPDTQDLCPLFASSDQTDDDADGIGNVCDPEFSPTFLYWEGTRNGGMRFVRPTDAYLRVEPIEYHRHGVIFWPDDGDEAFSISFGAAKGETLTVGVYENARDYEDDSPLLVTGGLDRCTDNFGRFEVHEIEIVGDEVIRFSADYSYGCSETSTDTYRGSARYHATDDPATITGTGLVDDAPAAGMTIEAVVIGSESVLGSTTTGPDGSFSLSVPGTPVSLRAVSSGAVPQWLGGHIFEDLTTMVPSGVGDTSSIDIAIKSGGAIAGRVDTVDGGRLIDTYMYLYDEDGVEQADWWEVRSYLADSGVQYYEAIGTDPGVYRVVVHPTNTNDAGMPYASAWYPSAANFFEAESVQLVAGEVTYADIEVDLAARLSVTITTADGGNAYHLYTDVYDPLDITGQFARQSNPQFWTVTEGTVFLLAANYDESENILWDYFPEWYDDAPELRLDLATPIEVEPGDRITVEIELDPFYPDMFDTVFTSDIAWMQAAGITQGCEGGARFCTDDLVTRGQMAAFLVRALGITASGDTDFVDDDDSIFESAIEKLAAAGITKGCNPPVNDRFCPDDYVTREQMAAFLVRALRLTDPGDVDFIDDEWSVFEESIEKLAAAGITKGCNPPANDKFCPGSRVTRGQMAAFLHRALTLPGPDGYAAPPTSGSGAELRLTGR